MFNRVLKSKVIPFAVVSSLAIGLFAGMNVKEDHVVASEKRTRNQKYHFFNR